MQTEGNGSLDVAEDKWCSFGACMNKQGNMHEQACLLNGESNIWAGSCQILKCTGDASVEGGIINISVGGRKFGTCVGQSTTGLVISHACFG